MLMKTYLWKLKEDKINKTNLFLYSEFIRKSLKVDTKGDFNKLWKWSIENPKIFWKSIWDFTKVKGDLGNLILDDSKIFYKNKFFPDSMINYAENLLKKKRFKLSNNI